MKGKFIILTLLMSFLLIVTSCSDQMDGATEDSGTASPPQYSSNDMAQEDYDGERDEPGRVGNIDPEKIITRLSLSFETVDFDDFKEGIEKLIEENEGYVEHSNLWYGGYSRAYRRGEYTIRVPRENLNRFKDHVSELGHLTNESSDRQNVTSQYRDTESRLRIVETKEERILALLETADLMTDIIELERELNNIVYEKEHLSQQLMGLDDRIDYSVVNLNVEEVDRLSTTEDLDTSLSTKIKNAFNDSIHFFYNTVENLIVFFVYSIPFLIVLAILGLIARVFYKKYKK